jgi:hypothetical protein
MLLVASSAYKGTPARVVREKIRGAWGTGPTTDRPYRTLVPAKRAWLPADSTEVRMTVFINDAATAVWSSVNTWTRGGRMCSLEPARVNTIVKGDVVVDLFDRSG